MTKSPQKPREKKPLDPAVREKIDQAVRYFYLYLLADLERATSYVKAASLYQAVLDQLQVTRTHGFYSQCRLFTHAALKNIERQGLLDTIDDRYADIFVRANEKTSQAAQFDTGFRDIEKKFTSLGDAGVEWLNSAMLRIIRNFSVPDLEEYIKSLPSVSPPRDLEKHVPPNPPLEDQAWEPLKIDRDNNSYQEAVAASEAALHEIESSNGYAASSPEERNGIVFTIQGTLKAIKEGMPSRATVIQGLLSPFQYISKKFADTTMGEIAKIAVAKLIAWLL